MLHFRSRTSANCQSKETERFVKFAVVGAAGAIVHFAILNVGLAFSMPFLAANTIGFVAAVLQNFVLNRIWTFPESRSRARFGQLIRFVIVSVVGLLINQGMALLCRTLLHPFWLGLLGKEVLSIRVNDNFAVAVAIGIVLFWNFLANRSWTYHGL